MPSARKLLRHEIVAILKAADIVGERVYANRFLHADIDDLPCIQVYARPESSQMDEIGSDKYDRTIDLVVEIVVANLDPNVSVDDTMDDLAQEVEDVFKANPNMNGYCLDTTLTGTEPDVNTEGEVPIGMLRLNYNTRYFA